MKTETIKISDITLDAGTQTRVELNEDRVSMFHEIIEEIGDMDPVEITFDGGWQPLRRLRLVVGGVV